MPARRPSRSKLEDTFLDNPVGTVVHLLAVAALCLVFILNKGHLTGDEVLFFAILMGSNAGVTVGRGLAARKAG